MITAFELNHWYVYDGPLSPSGWDGHGIMSAVTDGKPHQVVKLTDATHCAFDVTPRDNDSITTWYWQMSLPYFTEVPEPYVDLFS
jgi:hypothetical protein